MKPVAIVGAGPAGLAVAAALASRRIAYVLVDASGEPGGAYRTMHQRIALVSPSEMNALPGLRLSSRDSYPTAGELHTYLRDYADHHRLAIERAEVGNVDRRLVVTTDRGEIQARAVVVASGMWRFPKLPAIPGAPQLVHSSAYAGPTNERTLVIGGGASAIETAEEIASSGQQVWISMRRQPRFVPSHVLGLDLHRFVAPLERALPKWLARKHCAGVVTLPPTDRGYRRLVHAGQILVRPAIVRFDGSTAQFADRSSQAFDRVIAATGFEFRTPYLGRDVARAEGGHLEATRARSASWPNLYVIGHPCSVDLASQFLRGIARDSQLVAEDIARA